MAAKKKTVKSKQNTSVPQPKLYPLSSKKPKQKHKHPFHAVGVMKTEQEYSSYNDGMYHQYSAEQIATHIPQYQVVPFSKGKEPKPLSAKQLTQKRDQQP